ncbi:MAG: alkaline phosphatase family protein [Gemmatimonadota bacterium]
MRGSARPPVLLIALDAAEPRLIERWTDDGTLPNLRRLRASGAYGRLASSADWLAGSPWPTFYTGTTPGEHGLYHSLQWRADRMAPIRPSPDWLPLRPFWRDLGGRGCRVVAVDLPMTYPPEPFDGVEISGWATHDLLAPPASHPATLMDWVRREIGPSPITEEVYGPQRPASLLALKNELVGATRQVAVLGETLLRRERWDLFAIGFGATHRGGHKLWDASGALGRVDPDEAAALATALREVYAACDAAVGRLVEAAGDRAVVLVSSLHGMGPNTSRVEVLPAMLARILSGRAPSDDAPARVGGLKRLRGMVPIEWRNAVKSRLPVALQDRLTAFWRLGGTEWARTPAFSAIADLQGYVRINLWGREAGGIVAPADAERLCGAIQEGLETFVDEDTGEPIVEEIARADLLFPDAGRRDALPDLMVRWSGSPAARHRAITSPRYGTIPWPTPGISPDGRSGNHRAEGFLLAAGPDIGSGSAIEGGHILDLAPTICALLGVPVPAHMTGRRLKGVEPGGARSGS